MRTQIQQNVWLQKSMGFSFFPKSETGGHFQINNPYLTVCHRDLSVLFNIFMRDRSYIIEKSTLSTYVDHTQIFSTNNKLSKDEETINNDLISADIWLREMVWRGTVQNTRQWCWEKQRNWSASVQVWLIDWLIESDPHPPGYSIPGVSWYPPPPPTLWDFSDLSSWAPLSSEILEKQDLTQSLLISVQ